MQRFWRWLAIKLLVRSCCRRDPAWREDRRAYQVCTRFINITLIGQQPGTCYSVGGRRMIVLLGEGIHYMVGRTALRTIGSYFKPEGLMLVRPGPGQSWCWMLQFGHFDGR